MPACGFRILLATIVVARILGKVRYGELGMIQSTVGMFAVLGGYGLGLTATKHVAELRRTDPARAGRILGMSAIMALLIGGVMAIGLFLFSPWLAEHTINAPHLAGVLRIGALILLVNALNGAQTGALSGFEGFRAMARVNLLVGLTSFPILIGGAYFGGVTGAAWALAVNIGFTWLLSHIALRHEARKFHVPVTLTGWTCRMLLLSRVVTQFPALKPGPPSDFATARSIFLIAELRQMRPVWNRAA